MPRNVPKILAHDGTAISAKQSVATTKNPLRAFHPKFHMQILLNSVGGAAFRLRAGLVNDQEDNKAAMPLVRLEEGVKEDQNSAEYLCFRESQEVAQSLRSLAVHSRHREGTGSATSTIARIHCSRTWCRRPIRERCARNPSLDARCWP